MSSDWGYCDSNGPDKWCEWFPIGAKGKRQSPISIELGKTTTDAQLTASPLTFDHTPSDQPLKLANTARGWQVDYTGQSTITGGALGSDVYRLVQFHAHWGCEGCDGAEHVVDNKRAAAEVHFVYMNGKYGSVPEAIEHPDGLAVVGVLVDTACGDIPEHPELTKVLNGLNKVHYPNESTQIPHCDPTKFLPENKRMITYKGSLTTPPLAECVTWNLFVTSIKISCNQMSQFYQLYRLPQGDAKEFIHNNFRPAMSLGERTISCCDSIKIISH